MTRLTIITINLNNADGLRKTIESVISQTAKDIQYIVIDGGSDDGSVDVINEYADKIDYWVSEPDNGIYNAMNKGIKRSNGLYCQFVNSGDYLVDPFVVEKMLSASDHQFSIIYGNMLKLLKNKRIYKNGKVDTDSFLTFYKGTLNHSPSFIKRALFDKYGWYDENLKIVSDWKFFLIAVALKNEPVQYLDIDVTFFDINGISNTNRTLEKQERQQVLEELVPRTVLSDNSKYWFLIMQMERIKRYNIIYRIFWFIERVLFKIEKIFLS